MKGTSFSEPPFWGNGEGPPQPPNPHIPHAFVLSLIYLIHYHLFFFLFFFKKYKDEDPLPNRHGLARVCVFDSTQNSPLLKCQHLHDPFPSKTVNPTKWWMFLRIFFFFLKQKLMVLEFSIIKEFENIFIWVFYYLIDNNFEKLLSTLKGLCMKWKIIFSYFKRYF